MIKISYSKQVRDFIDAADVGGNLKNSRVNKDYLNLIDCAVSKIGRTKFIALYPIVGSIEYSHKFNFMNPGDSDAAFRLSFPNGATHNDNGVAFSPVLNQYANTFLNPSVSMTMSSQCMGVFINGGTGYGNGASINTSFILGAQGNNNTDGTNYANILAFRNLPQSFYFADGANSIAISTNSNAGFQVNSMIIGSVISGVVYVIKDGSLLNSTAKGTTGNLANNPLLLAATSRGAGGTAESYNDIRTPFFFVGTGLTVIETQYLTNSVRFAQRLKGRAV